MSDEFEDISVEAESPVASSGTEAPVAVEASAEPVGAEPVGGEIEATQVNLDPADNSLKQNSQQAYLETVAPDRVSESAAPITAAGHAAKEEAAERKKAEAHEHFEQEEKHAAARREWMEREHDFGGQKMSGHDLNKLLDFISNPQMQDKLRERLGKSGMPKDKVDKGMKELQEFIDLKKKEQEGGKLTDEEQRRLREIQKSEEFKVTATQSERIAREQGVEFSKEHMAAMTAARTSSDQAILSGAAADVKNMQATAKKINCDDFEDTSVPCLEAETPPAPIAQVVSKASYVAASARDDLPKTVALTETFTDTNASQIAAASNKSTLALGATDPLVSAETVAIANTNNVTYSQKPPVVAASASF